jgi:hypothetical protein
VYRTYDEATLPLPTFEASRDVTCGEEEQVKRALLVLCDVQQPQKKRKKRKESIPWEKETGR